MIAMLEDMDRQRYFKDGPYPIVLYHCKLAFPSTFVPNGRTSRFLRHLSPAAAGKAYFAIPGFHPQK